MQRVVIEPTSEPVTIEDARWHLRLDDSLDASEIAQEDAYLQSLITTARQWCEKYTGRPIAVQTMEETFSAFPITYYLALHQKPILSIVSVIYTDTDNVSTTFAASNYIADLEAGCVVLKPDIAWPYFEKYRVEPIKVRYTAGFATVPETIKQAILLLVGHWYENREASIVGQASAQIQFSVKAILDQYRIRWWD